MNHMFAVRCIRRLWRLGQRRRRHQVRAFFSHPFSSSGSWCRYDTKKMITVCIGMSMWTSWPQVGLPDRVAWQRPRLPPSSPPYRPGLLDQASYLFLLCMNLYNMAWLLTILTRFEARIWKLWLRDLFIIGPESDHWECLSLTHSLTHWLTHSLLFSKLDWCDPDVWRCQLKTCWGC